MAEKKLNLASDDAYIQAFNRLRATHDINKKININIKNDSSNNNTNNDDRDDKSINSSKISSSQSLSNIYHKNLYNNKNSSSTKVKRNVNNIMQVIHINIKKFKILLLL